MKKKLLSIAMALIMSIAMVGNVYAEPGLDTPGDDPVEAEYQNTVNGYAGTYRVYGYTYIYSTWARGLTKALSQTVYVDVYTEYIYNNSSGSVGPVGNSAEGYGTAQVTFTPSSITTSEVAWSDHSATSSDGYWSDSTYIIYPD